MHYNIKTIIIIIYSIYFSPYSIYALQHTGCEFVDQSEIKQKPRRRNAQFCPILSLFVSLFSRKLWRSTVIWFQLFKEKKKAHWHYFALMIFFCILAFTVLLVGCCSGDFVVWQPHIHRIQFPYTLLHIKNTWKSHCNITFQGDGWFTRGKKQLSVRDRLWGFYNLHIILLW